MKIKLKYKRGLFWRIKEVEYPARWEDLSGDQFIDVVSVVTRNYITEADNIFLLNTILGLKEVPLFNWPEKVSLLNRFIFDIQEPFSKLFIKEIQVPRLTLYGPSDGFTNMKLGEFSFADTYFMSYIRQHHMEHLNSLIACIYRPAGENTDIASPDYKGDIREPFNENIIEYRAKLIDSIPRREKEAILFNYRIIRKWIEKKYVWVFPEKGQPQNKIKLSGSAESGWDKFMRSLCNGDITRLDMVAEQYLHNVLAEANDSIMENQKNQ